MACTIPALLGKFAVLPAFEGVGPTRVHDVALAADGLVVDCVRRTASRCASMRWIWRTIALMRRVLRSLILFLTISALPAFGDLASDSTIRRDTFGIPHILAKTEEAASFAMGYAQAEDYCVEIARRFLSARGEQAK